MGLTVLVCMAALSSLEREAKENVYAVLDPHIQYDITINKHGEPPKYLSLSKPLTHQRTHAFNPHNVPDKEINNNDYERFSSFKAGPPKARRSSNRQHEREQNFVSKTNNDIEYSKDPFFGKARNTDCNQHAQKYNEHRDSKKYLRMYDRNNSGRKQNDKIHNDGFEKDYQNTKRSSNRSWKSTQKIERSFEDSIEGDHINREKEVDFKPRPGKVKEIASRFNMCSGDNVQSFSKNQRPKPLQSYGDQAYLDHVFPDAVEI
ncbi:unnamed protein product [Arctia plantaginis]|uniref:Uncharacterized protein n=1 Tax=Arctia plantaginis TaxID=874455 RepID=A0A8S0Z2M9_ARCPL|nr:unnamed protein product [Arctia plantaginis]